MTDAERLKFALDGFRDAQGTPREQRAYKRLTRVVREIQGKAVDAR